MVRCAAKVVGRTHILQSLVLHFEDNVKSLKDFKQEKWHSLICVLDRSILWQEIESIERERDWRQTDLLNTIAVNQVGNGSVLN